MLVPKTNPSYQPTKEDLSEIKEKMLELEHLFRPFGWDEARWSQYKASNDFKKMVPYHLFAAGLFLPEHRHILNHYHWVPFFWPGPEEEHLLKQSGWKEWLHKDEAAKKFRRHREKRNKYVREYLASCAEVAAALGVPREGLHPGGAVADADTDADFLFEQMAPDVAASATKSPGSQVIASP